MDGGPRRPAGAASARGAHQPDADVWKRYNAFLRLPPEMTIAWNDAETGARAWLVVNSSRGGAAGGGTRMRAALQPREVVYLAKTMELKFSISGPPIGGAKCGIAFDPRDPRKTDVLERWYRAITPILRDRFGTGGDLNIDEVRDVLPAFHRLGLEHPQEGIVRGHVRPHASAFRRIIRRLDAGVEADVPLDHGLDGASLTIADVVTGFGLATAVRRFHERMDRPLQGARVSVEGFGNVGAACSLYLARAGARIVAARDARSVLTAPDGLDAADVEDLIRRSTDKMLPTADPRVRSASTTSLFDTPSDIFVCAAISGSVARDTLDRLATAGVRVIASGANQPFREAKLGSTRVAQLADRRFAVLPDILANCGMARTFSYLMERGARPTAPRILGAVERTITENVDEVFDRTHGGDRGWLASTYALALDRVGVDTA